MHERYRILLVEDDEVDRMAFARFVRTEHLPYELTITGSIAEAILALATKQFDVALMDYSLRDGKSLDLFEAARHIPIIIVTGSSDLHIAVELMKAGAYDLLTKDPNGNYLITLPFTVKHTIERWQAQQELTEYRNNLEKVIAERTEARDKVEAILNNSTDAILLVRTDLHIQQANAAFIRMLTSTQEDFTEKFLLDYIHPDDAAHVMNVIQTAIEERRDKQIKMRVMRKDRTFFEAEFGIGIVNAGNEHGIESVVCTIHDITEGKALERQLRYHASLQDNVSDAVIVTDVAFRIQSWNKAAEQIYGWSAEEIIGKTIEETVRTQFESEEHRKRFRRAFFEQGYWKGEAVQYRKDGTPFPLLGSITLLKDDQGIPFGVISVIHDITEQKAQERQLRYHASLQDNVSDAVIVTDMAFRIQSWNKAAERIYGWSAEEVINKETADVLQTRYTSVIDQASAINQLLEQGWWQGEVIQSHKDGSICHILGSVTLVKDETGVPFGVVSVNHDITERNKVQEALQESEARIRESEALYRLLADSINDVVMRFNVNVEYLYVSPSSRVVTGYEPEELLGPSDFQRIHPDDVPAIQALIRELIENPVRAAITYRFRHKAGHYIWLETSGQAVVSKHTGKVVEFVMSARDVTQRKNAEIALREQHEFLQQVINNVPGLVAVKDRNGRFQLVNRQLAKIHGSTPETMLGKMDANFNPNQAEVDFFLQKDDETLADGQAIFISEETIFGRYYQTSKVPLKNHDDEYDRLLVVSSDITERKKAEEALQQAFEKEKELGELKSRFVSMASHEFRTPLATIFALADTLSGYRHKMTEDVIEMRLTKIRSQIMHLTEIMEDVLQLGRMQSDHIDFTPIEFDLDALCREIIEDFQERPDIMHQLLYSAEITMPMLRLDKKLIRQVMNNLISNAIKYSPEGKNITVSLRQTSEAITLSVRDEGIGIPEVDLKYLFEPFHRAGNVGTIRGTGLGLTITKASVELHGGTIVVDSTVGVGTTFIVSLPLT